MLVVMAENFVPAAAREFFLVLRKRLMEFPRSRKDTQNVQGRFLTGLKGMFVPRSSEIESCTVEYSCSLEGEVEELVEIVPR